MTHDTEALRGLLAKVEAATGADPALDRLICCEFEIAPWSARDRGNVQFCMTGSKSDKATPKLTASIDAAWALVERVLPNWGGRVSFGPPSTARLWHRQYSDKTLTSHEAPTPALAILGSLLSAALTQGAHHEA